MRDVSSPNAWLAPVTPHMLQLLSKSLIVGVVVICVYGDGVKMGMIVSFTISKFSGSKILSHKNINHEYLLYHMFS